MPCSYWPQTLWGVPKPTADEHPALRPVTAACPAGCFKSVPDLGLFCAEPLVVGPIKGASNVLRNCTTGRIGGSYEDLQAPWKGVSLCEHCGWGCGSKAQAAQFANACHGPSGQRNCAELLFRVTATRAASGSSVNCQLTSSSRSARATSRPARFHCAAKMSPDVLHECKHSTRILRLDSAICPRTPEKAGGYSRLYTESATQNTIYACITTRCDKLG